MADIVGVVFRNGIKIYHFDPAGLELSRGDRVVVKTLAGEVLAKQLSRLTAQRVDLKSLNPAYEDRSFALSEIAFIHRIIWASQ